MKHDSRPLGNLASSSVRQNRGLLLLGALVLIFVTLLGWAIQRLLDEENTKVRYHFSRLAADIHEHESYLLDVANQFRNPSPDLPGGNGSVMLQSQGIEAGRKVYRGSWLSVSLPFTLAFSERYDVEFMDARINIAVRLAGYYGNYWSGSEYESPQVLLFSQDPQFSLALPAADYSRINKPIKQTGYLSLIDYTRERLMAELTFFSDSSVRWVRSDAQEPRVLNAVILINIPEKMTPAPQHPTGMLTSRLDLDQVEDIQRVLERPIYDSFTLLAPSGDVLMGPKENDEALPEGLSLDRHGIHFRISSAYGDRWTGIYVISYSNFLRLAKWPLLGLLLILVGSFACAWFVNRWYRAKIVNPAQLAHQRLVESQTFITDVIDSAPTGLSLVRRNDRQVLLENQSARLWGGTTELLDLVLEQPESTEFCMKVEERYLQVFFVPTRYRGDDVLLCAFIDITQHRNDNTELAQAKLSADQASEAKTLFLATMSHEIRTPLYGVMGNLELLALTELDRRQRTYLQTIQSASASLSALISDVLDVSKIEAGQFVLEPSAFDPRELAQSCMDAIAPQASAKHLQLDIGLDPRLPARLLGDPARLRQIIANLLNNALKFTEAGRISLNLSVVEQDSHCATVRWQVTDTGIGIPRTKQARLFEPFYQVPGTPREGGTGLGLSICASLSEMMGGSLRVVSDSGLGSSFFLEVPLTILPDEPSAMSFADRSNSPLNLRVLVAEDNPINRAILEEQLTAMGAQVVTAAHGEEALQRWQPGAFDVVITDVNMPYVNGYELTSRLRESGATVPIVGVTANAMREEGQHCLAVGMNAWVVKPLSLDTLRTTLLKVCRPTESVPETESGRTSSAPEDTVDVSHLSDAMRTLFIETMRNDLAKAREALAASDSTTLVQCLHTMSGAYAVVRASTLADECFTLETQILEHSLTSSLALQADALLKRLTSGVPPHP